MSGHSKRKHSKFPPSSAERWIQCAGSVSLAQLAPVQPDSPQSIEGTNAHECLEFIVRRFKDKDAARDEALKKDCWPEEMVYFAIKSAELIFSDKLCPSPHAELLIEQRVYHRFEKKLFGSLDYAWVDLWGTLVVIDYKYGKGPVFVKNHEGKLNAQLMTYAVAVAGKYNYDFEKVRIAIIQPRIYNDDETPLSVVDVSIKELKKFEKDIAEAVKIASKPNAPLHAGEHCRYCPALPTCPENSKKALAKANILFDMDEGLQEVPKLLTLNEKNLPKILDAFEQIEDWMQSVRAIAEDLLKQGKKIEGWGMVPKRGQRVWTKDAEKAMLQAFGNKALSKPELLSPSKLQQKVGASAKPLINKFTVTVSSGDKLAPVKDKPMKEVFEIE